MAEGVPITNTLFPPPPEYYKAFTPEAVERLAELRSKDEGGEERERLQKEQDPPRTDWILEDGRWMAFGQQYTVSVYPKRSTRPRDFGPPQELHGSSSKRIPGLPTMLSIAFSSLICTLTTSILACHSADIRQLPTSRMLETSVCPLL